MIVFLIIVTILLAYFLWSRRRFYAFSLKMPGPVGLPFIGIAHKLYNIANMLYVLPEIASQCKAKTYFFWLGHIPFIYTKDPAVVELVLSSDCINKSKVYDTISDTLGDGLVTSKSPRWNKHRKLLNPAFNYQNLLTFIPNFNRLCQDLCKDLDIHADGDEVNMNNVFLDLGITTSITTTMGQDIEYESKQKLRKCFETSVRIYVFLTRKNVVFFFRIMILAAARILNPLLRNSFIFRLTSMYKPMIQAQTYVMDWANKLAMNKIKVLKHQEENTNSIAASTEGQSVDIKKVNNYFMDRVIQINLNKLFTRDDVVCEANLMVLAASDSTATTLMSAFIFLAMYPQYQEKLFDEILTIFPDEEFQVTNEHIKNLVYLDMFINETLRFAPSIPMIGRDITNDLALSHDIAIPKGTQVLVDIFNIQRDEDVWGPDALTFNPDHFLPENLSDKHKYSFMPFSKGQRNCIGWQYARILIKVAMVQILRKYRFSTSFKFEDLRFIQSLTLKYEKIPHLKIHRRQTGS